MYSVVKLNFFPNEPLDLNTFLLIFKNKDEKTMTINPNIWYHGDNFFLCPFVIAKQTLNASSIPYEKDKTEDFT